jgi:uncharacterized protein YcbK (DUF882 family)
MGTWVKETDEAIYLMQGNQWISKITKKPSSSNPQEQVLNIEGMRSWFTRADFPGGMTISVGIDASEPEQAGGGGGSEGGGGGDHNGMTIRVLNDTYFKLKPEPADALTEAEKVLVPAGTEIDIQYYVNVGNDHSRFELLNPVIGDQQRASWYVYTPDLQLITDMVITTTVDTFFKAEPKLSSQLPEASKILVKKGTQFQLIASEPAEGDHEEVHLANTTLGEEKERKWFVYHPDATIEGNRQSLRVISDTIFKAKPVQSSQLSNDDKIFVKNGTVFLLKSYDDPEQNHVRVALQGAFLGPQNRTAWYAYLPDIQVIGTEFNNKPDDTNPWQPPETANRGVPLTFPGFAGTYYSNDPIQWTNRYGTKGNFTWGEALHVNPSTGSYRKPASAGVVYNILKMADVLEEIRRMYGDRPMKINSWYRDPATNAAIGGASRSRHMSGDAVDFVFPGISPFNVYARLDGWWGKRGGLASSSLFTHIDGRGYRARWSYGY